MEYDLNPLESSNITFHNIFDSVTLAEMMIIGAERKKKRFAHDRFGLTADSVNCDEIHLK